MYGENPFVAKLGCYRYIYKGNQYRFGCESESREMATIAHVGGLRHSPELLGIPTELREALNNWFWML